ncbi:ATP-binding protein [Zooshikella marina]|uniref:ATP-binding protein n=1 Tax=Zooshikella ganghwensis TaxID=202772 RepID=UPI001BB0A91B|nr:ATP-binding protein [Zooshikella ganghwensis]MBU2707551.1 ATP-binding protein [Zooshikella ganghwensis]
MSDLQNVLHSIGVIPLQLYQWLQETNEDANNNERLSFQEQKVKQSLYLQKAQAKIDDCEILQTFKPRFQLTNLELNCVLLCALPCIIPHYRSIYHQLSGQEAPTISFLLDLLFNDEDERYTALSDLFNGQALKWRLFSVQKQQVNVVNQSIHLAPDVLQWLVYQLALARDKQNAPLKFSTSTVTRGLITEVKPPPWLSLSDLSDIKSDVTENHSTVETSVLTNTLTPNDKSTHDVKLFVITGASGEGKRTQALRLASLQHKPLVELNHGILEQFQSPATALMDSLRQSMLMDSIVYWPQGIEYLANHPELCQVLEKWFALPATQLYLGHSTSFGIEDIPKVLLKYPSHVQALTPLESTQQAGVWKSIFSYFFSYKNIEALNWNVIVEKNQLLPGQIVRIAQHLRLDIANIEPIGSNDSAGVTTQQVIALIQGCAPDHLAGLARRLDSAVSLDDCIIADDVQEQLKEIIQYFPSQSHSLGLPSEYQGTKLLLYGPPGTGKTLCAQALANTLAIPIYRIDLAAVASKWIGETEKNLAEVFTLAEQQRCVLFFDEADSLFNQRTDIQSAHDKNTNLGVNYLLQRIESFTGLLVLATNYQDNLDSAFFRRLDYVIEMKLPSPAMREKIWESLWPDYIHYSKKEFTFHYLGSLFPLSGAQIANITKKIKRIQPEINKQAKEDATVCSKQELAKLIESELNKQTKHSGHQYLLDVFLSEESPY